MEAECEGCWRTIRPEDTRYHCPTCDWVERCSACYADKRAPHAHEMLEERGHPWTCQDAVQGPDCVTILSLAFNCFAGRWCLGWRPTLSVDGTEVLAASYKWHTFKEVGLRVRHFAAGLSILGIEARSHLAICSPNRLEWYLADFACVYRSVISVALHTNSHRSDMLYILKRVQATCVVCSPEFVKLFEELAPSLPALQYIIHFDKNQPSLSDGDSLPAQATLGTYPQQHQTGVKILRFSSVERQGALFLAENPTFPIAVPNKPDDVVTVVYTSGSTGLPKGTIYTERLWHDTLRSRTVLYAFPKVYMTSGPLSASSTRKNTERALCNGSRVGCFSGGVDRILEEIPILRPTILSGPPITWITVHQLYTQALNAAYGGAKNALEKQELKAQVMARFRKMLGSGCIRMITIGGAPVPKEVLQFTRKLFGNIEIRESYGATEIGGIYSNKTVSSDVELKLVDWEEYKTTDKPFPRGEVWVRSPTITPGYYLDEEQTKENFEDGWFKTGDIGMLQQTGDTRSIELIDRKKNLFKLAQGLFVVPEKIEAALTIGCPSIRECFVYGDGSRSHLVAVVVPRAATAVDGEADHHVGRQRLKHEIAEGIRAVSKKQEMRYYEVPRDVILAREPFSEHNGQRTITGKLNRRALAVHYRADIDAAYARTTTQARLTRDTIRDAIAHTISPGAEQLHQQEGQQASLLELGGDSLGAVNLMKIIRERFAVSLPLAMVLERPIDELAEYVERHSGGGGAASGEDSPPQGGSPSDQSTAATQSIDWRRDSRLDPETIRLLDEKCQASSQVSRAGAALEVRGVFVTGVTGFLGAFLLHRILAEFPSATVWCLVRVGPRQADEDAAMRRVRDHMKDYGLWDDAQAQRIRPVAGELSLDRFGLSRDRFDALGDEAEVIFHCGAWVNSLLSYSSLVKGNVVGTRNVVRLAATGRTLSVVHHISSLSVLQDRGTARAHEEDEDLKQLMRRTSGGGGGDVGAYLAALRSGYRQTKCVAELLLRRGRKRGLPVNVFRCGMIVGEAAPHCARGGVANESDWVGRLLCGIVHMRSYPACRGVEFNFVPVDSAAAAIVKIAKHTAGQPGGTFHINNFSQATTFDTLLEGVRRFMEDTASSSSGDAAAPSLEAVTYLAWRRKIDSSDESNPLYVVRSMFRSWFPGTSSAECGKTVALLQAIADSSRKLEEGTDGATAKVACHPIDSRVVASWLHRFKAKDLV